MLIGDGSQRNDRRNWGYLYLCLNILLIERDKGVSHLRTSTSKDADIPRHDHHPNEELPASTSTYLTYLGSLFHNSNHVSTLCGLVSFRVTVITKVVVLEAYHVVGERYAVSIKKRSVGKLSIQYAPAMSLAVEFNRAYCHHIGRLDLGGSSRLAS